MPHKYTQEKNIRYLCDQADNCAGELRMLYEKLQKEECGEDDMS